MGSRRSLPVVALLVGACAGSPAPSTNGPGGPTPLTASAAATASPATSFRPSTAAPTLAPGESPPPTPTLPPIGIVGVECLAGQTVRLHVSITDDRGVVSYQLWSTWGGGGEVTRSFPTPYRTNVDEQIELTHAIVDPEPRRIHQFGLAVTLAGVADPVLTYAIEPDDRCAGH